MTDALTAVLQPAGFEAPRAPHARRVTLIGSRRKKPRPGDQL
jgi:hypothetical protein